MSTFIGMNIKTDKTVLESRKEQKKENTKPASKNKKEQKKENDE